jgi:signal transduction histidine kinase
MKRQPNTNDARCRQAQAGRLRYVGETSVLVAGIAFVAAVTWLAPSLSAAAANALFRWRGVIPAPDDVVIVAIDDESLRRLGQWPWPRAVMAQTLDRIASSKPRAIGLDVIYAEPSTLLDDERLASAIARSGRVVLPAQLIETAREGLVPSTVWMRPLPKLEQASAAVGHAHVSPDVDGMLRSIQLSKADDEANRLWAFGFEVVRIGERIESNEIEEREDLLRMGAYVIPLRNSEPVALQNELRVVRPNEALLNYVGPAGSFHSYSLADVLDGALPSSAFEDKIVLIGAVAPSMGDTRVSPFMHYAAGDRQAGQEMPGIEIHANLINTIRQRLWLRQVSEGTSFLAALLVMFVSMVVVRMLDGWRQIASLGVLLMGIVGGSYVGFARYQVVAPLAPMLTGFVVVVPLMLNRTLSASRELDRKLARLLSTQTGFLLDEAAKDSPSLHGRSLPRTFEWKLRALDGITERLLARMSFMNLVLTSMGEGVVVSDRQGRIVFANREAASALGEDLENIIRADFDEALISRSIVKRSEVERAYAKINSGSVFEKEFTLAGGEARHYLLHLSAIFAEAVPNGNDRSGTIARLEPEVPIGTVALFSDITKRAELERVKAATLQLVSHELRTPLTSIQGLSDVLLKFSVPTNETREMLDTIHTEAVRLSETINRYLDLTRLESGVQPLKLERVPPAQLVDECVRALAPVAAEKGVTFVCSIPDDFPSLNVDAQLFTLAINNLLSNAVKYGPGGSEILIRAELDGRAVRLSVRDHGPGIPLEEREHIFEKFYRLNRETSSGVVGTGLGLSLVKEIVEKHGGRVSIEDASPSGSTFTISLPDRRS